MSEAERLERIEQHFDAAPRAAADVEEHGALTLFVSRIPWRFYGRPRLGLAEDVGADDVAAVRARQRELGVRERFEWVHETTPSPAGAAAAAGLEVLRVPLLRRRGIGGALTGRLVHDARERGAEVVCLSAADDDARTYERLGFRRIGTACFGYPTDG